VYVLASVNLSICCLHFYDIEEVEPKKKNTLIPRILKTPEKSKSLTKTLKNGAAEEVSRERVEPVSNGSCCAKK
jgi:hypothetical protein